MARALAHLLAPAALLAGLLLAPATAEASHGRYYHYSASHAGGNSFDFTLNEGWRRNSLSCYDISSGQPVFASCSPGDGSPQVGDVVRSDNFSFSFGDGTTVALYLLVTAISIQENSLTGVALDPAEFPRRDSTIRHTYPQPGDYLGFAGTCCRISNLQNNADGSFRAEVKVTAGATNGTPVSALPPVVRCPVGGTCSFLIPASDPNGDPTAFRFATDLEASGSPGGFVQPNGSAIAANGTYSFNTTQARGGQPGVVGDLYSTQVVIEDLDGSSQGKSKVALDFIIQLVSDTGSSPTFASPPTPCNGSITAIPGQQVSFDVQASDADAGDTVELNAAGLPAGASMNPRLPVAGSPGGAVSSTFTWTPDGQATGTNVVTFTATDSSGRQTLCSVEVLVNPVQVSDVSVSEGAPARFSVALSAAAGVPVSVDYRTEQGTATVNQDFAPRSGTVTIPAGTTGVTVEVPTIDDALAEPNETFTLELSNAQGAPLGKRAGTATIVDDDAAPPAAAPLEISVDPLTASYTRVQRHILTATVRRSGAPVGGQALLLRVTGANQRSDSDRSDSEGRVYFSWFGQANGTDTAVAFVDENGDGQPQASEPSARATVTWRGGLPRGIETASSIEDLPRPGLFQDANFEPVGSGDVTVKLPASLTAQTVNKGFIPLREAAQLPVGTIINTDQGRIAVQSAVRSRSRRVRSADFYGGTFRFTQPPSRTATTQMVMQGGSFRACSLARRRAGRAVEAESSRRRPGGRTVRRLWGSGKGRFRTRGRYSSATVRGTRWLVEDRCEGTLTRVRSGTVQVRDFPRRRTVTVRAGRSHLAARRPPRSLTKR